jgi:hypothetical protein
VLTNKPLALTGSLRTRATCGFSSVTVDLAGEGKTANGYEALVLGLYSAERRRAEGKPWAKELERTYREARERYARLWAVGRA